MSAKYKAIKVGGRKKDEHRHIVETSVGRKLDRDEVVHHKDGDKTNNSLSNLEIMTLSEHSRMHQIGKLVSDATRDKLREAGIRTRTNAKLAVDKVIEIKQLLARGTRLVDVAAKYNLPKTTVSNIKRGASWGWV
jgi:hypothetical protein